MNCGTVIKWNIIYLLFPVDVYGESLMIFQSDVKEGKGQCSVVCFLLSEEVFISVYVCVHTCATTYLWMSGDNLWESILPFRSVFVQAQPSLLPPTVCVLPFKTSTKRGVTRRIRLKVLLQCSLFITRSSL